jgi:XTP/dITP diphosphohydrolase
MPMTLYAATSNPGKLAEFEASASTAGFAVRALPGLADIPEPSEDAATFMGNAEIKAVAYSLRAPGKLVFADDSGLEVDALGGEPGVRSARYADDRGFEADDPEAAANRNDRNMRCLISRMAALQNSPRGARFLCALALARDGEILLRAEGAVGGEILPAPRGAGGFGYDPLFLIPSLGLTLAELPREQKWKLSHRGRAFRALLAELAG